MCTGAQPAPDKPVADGASVAEALAQAAARLGDRFEAELLLQHALGRDRAWLMAHAREALSASQASALQALIRRREAGEPVAYIMGRRGFWKMDLAVSPDVLIPRPETELLVEQALQRLPATNPCRVADLGTGSGAVALAIAMERPWAQVLATDASEAALAVARANAERLDVCNVGFAAGDWWQPLTGQVFDLIVSNPPYVAAGDPHLGQGDLPFEPAMALASGADGLDAIRGIIAAAPRHLEAGGWLLLEHGWDQGEGVRELLAAAGLATVMSARDLQGFERVSGGQQSAPDVNRGG